MTKPCLTLLLSPNRTNYSVLRGIYTFLRGRELNYLALSLLAALILSPASTVLISICRPPPSPCFEFPGQFPIVDVT